MAATRSPMASAPARSPRSASRWVSNASSNAPPTTTGGGTEVYGGPYVDRVEFIDYGTDPSAFIAAAESDEVDLLYETVGEFIDVMDAIGWTQTETVTAATLVFRGNQEAEVDGMKPYADKRVRQALALAVDNSFLLELGYSNRGRGGREPPCLPDPPGLCLCRYRSRHRMTRPAPRP